MTLGDLIYEVELQGKIRLSVWKNDKEIDKADIGFTDGLRRCQEYFSYGKWIHVSDYEDLEIRYIYASDGGTTIEMAVDE
jgi:hypothetical protein